MKELILEIKQNKPGEPFILVNQETKEEIKNILDPRGSYSFRQILGSNPQNEYYNAKSSKIYKLYVDVDLNIQILTECDVTIQKSSLGMKDFLQYDSKSFMNSSLRVNECLCLGCFIPVYPNVAECCDYVIERL